jgi:hypothetical protein
VPDLAEQRALLVVGVEVRERGARSVGDHELVEPVDVAPIGRQPHAALVAGDRADGAAGPHVAQRGGDALPERLEAVAELEAPLLIARVPEGPDEARGRDLVLEVAVAGGDEDRPHVRPQRAQALAGDPVADRDRERAIDAGEAGLEGYASLVKSCLIVVCGW